MRFTFSTLIAIVLAAPVAAQDDGLTGYWKFNVCEQGQQTTFWLIHIDRDKDKKPTVTFEATRGAPGAKFVEMKQDGDTFKIKFVATFPGQQVNFDYEGRLPKPGAKKVFGSIQGGRINLAIVLEATSAKSVFELDREAVQKMPGDPRGLAAIADLIERAKDNKVEAKDLQSWIDGSLKAAEQYGPRFHQVHAISILERLKGQKMYAAVGVDTARQVAKGIDPKLPIDTQAQIIQLASRMLRDGGEAKEAEALDVRLDKLEVEAYADYSKVAFAELKTVKFAGRKAKSNRAVLVELFTGAQCPPCVACDMAFDGVERTYGPGEAVLLQYHLHVPGAEPMSAPDSYDRFDYYADAYKPKVRGTPSNFFNGKLDATGGGSREDAEDKYKEFCGVINKMLETPDTVKLSATAVRKGDKIAITAKVAGLDKPGEKVRLRLALVEDWVRYKGGNGMQYHHRVVRAMPKGAEGINLKQKGMEHQATVDIEELRAALNKFLNEEYPPDSPRPMRMRNLSGVAFVQDDANYEVLQAVNVPVREDN
jgi:hypothetical protein